MQQNAYPVESSGKVALREGAIVGVILGATHLVLSLIDHVNQNAAISLLLLGLIVLAWLAAFFIVGIRASKRTALVSTGTLAGLWTGVFGGIIGAIVNILFELTNIDAARASAQAAIDRMGYNFHYTNEMIIGVNVLGNVCLLLIGIGLGAGLGALGGLPGRSWSPLRFAAYPYAQPPFPPPYPPPPGQSYPPSSPQPPYAPPSEQVPSPYPPTPPPPEQPPAG